MLTKPKKTFKNYHTLLNFEYIVEGLKYRQTHDPGKKPTAEPMNSDKLVSKRYTGMVLFQPNQKTFKNYHTFLNFKLLVASLKYRQTHDLGGKRTAEPSYYV